MWLYLNLAEEQGAKEGGEGAGESSGDREGDRGLESLVGYQPASLTRSTQHARHPTRQQEQEERYLSLAATTSTPLPPSGQRVQQQVDCGA